MVCDGMLLVESTPQPVHSAHATGRFRPIAACRYRKIHMDSRSLDGYTPPQNRAELEQRYAAGERCFPNTDLSDEDLSGIKLDGADFEKHSWFSDADFSGASLRGTSFRECNLKCVNFSNCDLTGAILERAAIESIKAKGAAVAGVKVRGATFYGCELAEGDELPSWEW